MNRQCYQLVFNRHRGMLMAVAETASTTSGQRSPMACGAAGVVAPASWKFCTLVLALALTWQSVAHAQILVDRNAPREEQPMVLKAANGVPVVNIRQPNAKGLSVNSYRRFDVDGRGVILNNAGGSSKSELAGYIAGNPWMPEDGAQVIVDQVNATDPSYLRGFIEVAGNPAQVIIANPAGITCAGCGFINAQRATMTTGTPVIRQGNLESYRVNSGVISFEGLGLQANDTAYADVIARAVRVHAELRAKQIRLTTGLNTVSADHAQVTPDQSATDGAPVRAIDVAALGGMYAGHIYLSATEHGVGVHNGGTLTATEGQLVVTAAGRLENTGTLAARGDTVIAAAGAVSNAGSGTMGSESTLRIHATALDNAGTLDASRQLQIRTTGALINQGSLGARDSTLLEVGTLENTGTGRIGSTGDTRVQSSGSIRNAGSLLGDTGVTLAAVTLENTGSVLTPATLALRMRNMLDNSGKIGSNARLELRATTLTNRGDIYSARESVQLQVAGRLFNSGSIEAKRTLDAEAVAIENQGRFIGEAALNASASAALTNAGTMGSRAGADFKAATLDNRGTLSAVQLLALKVTGKFTNEKNVGAGSTLQIDADALDNSGKLFSHGSLLMRIGGAALNSGKIGADGTVDFRTASLVNGGALYSLAKSVDIQTRESITNSGTVEAKTSVSLKAAALNNSGTFTAEGTMKLSLQQGLSNTGEIGANDTLTVNAATLENRGRIRSAESSLELTTDGKTRNQGKILADTRLEITATGIDNSDGTLGGGEVVIDARNRRFNNQRGVLFARQDLKAESAELDNRAGSIAARGKLTLSSGEVNNEGGLLQALKSLDLDTHGQALYNQHSGKDQGVRAGTALHIKAGALGNGAGVVVAGGEARLQVSTLDNQGGDIATGGGLRIEAGSVDNRGGQLQSKGAMRVEVSAGDMDNRRGLMRSDEDITLQSQSLRNDDTQGKDQGIEGRSVSVTTGALYNNNGAIRTGQSLQIAASDSVDNRGGLLSSQGTLSVNDLASTPRLVIDNEGGRILAGGDLSLTSHSLIGKGLLLSHRNLRIDVATDLEQYGETVAGGDLDLRTGGRFSNYGTLAAGAALRVTATGFQNHAGASILGGDVSLSAGASQDFINRGLVDGVTTRIQAGTLYNLGAGRIYGDRVALAADVLHNAPEIIDGVQRAPVIAARERLDIGTGLLYNSEQALLYSVGDMSIGGAIGSDHRATGRAREVNNTSATVNADGALTIAADAINNRNAHFEIAEESKPGRRVIRYRLDGSPDFISSDEARIIHKDNGQIIAPENWRAMGDEDNFRLLLASAKYPFEKFGAASDYKHAAYQKPEPETWTESGSVPEVPEVFFYTPEDPIWERFGIARPAPLAPEPKKPLYWTFPEAKDLSEHLQEQYRTLLAWQAWKEARTAFVKSYVELDEALQAFRKDYQRRLHGQWIIYDGTEQIQRTTVTRSAPGMITSGGAMTLAAGVVNNYASQFIAGGLLAGDAINGTAINNTGPMGRQTVTSTGTAEKTFIRKHWLKADERRYESAPYASQTIETQFPLDVSATHEAGSTRERTPRTPATVPAQALPDAGKTADLRAPAVDVSLPANALYQVNQSSVAAPLVRTDPRFIGQRNWLSSDFLVRAYQDRFGPAPGYQRFGDGFYEQQLIQRQIQEATGQRYLNGFSNNEAQYLALMQAGLQQAQVQRYALGIALSEAQIAQLKTDIVWLVQRRVTLADGREQEVLVPQVYLQPSSLRVSGRQTLIAGNEVAFQTVQDILNRGGTIAARTGVTLRADNVRNLGGRIEGGSVRLLAQSDIENAGGVIDANDKLVLSAGRDVVLRSTSVTTANAITTGRNIDQVASVSGKDVVLLAGRDLQADAAVIAASGDAVLAAGRDVRLGVVQEYFRQEIRWADDKGGSNWVSRLTGPNLVDRANGAHGTSEVGINRAVVTGSKDVSTQVSGNNISIQAGQDVTSKGAQVVAENALQVEAGRDIHIGTANVSASARDQGQRSSSGILTARTVRTDDASSTSREAGSTFSGETVLVRSGNDMNVKGSQIVSTQGTTLAAGNNVNIVAATDSSTQRNFRQETKSGVMGAGFGVTVGSRVQSQDVDGQSKTAAASTVGSVEGNVSIVAGNRYTQVGSDVVAPGGDIDIVARTVSILAAQQSSHTVTEDKFRQQGVTVAVTSPVLSAVQTVQQMAEAASKTRDRRTQALAAATAGLAASNAADAVIAGQGKTINDKPNQIATGPTDPATGKTPARDANAADKAGGINLAFSLGASSSQGRSEQTHKTVRGSSVSAGGSVAITANGEGGDGNILVQGSDIKAGVDGTLKAANEVRLMAAQETSAQHSRNSGASGSVGFSIGTDGLLFTASASGNRGKGDGEEVRQVNSHVDAGNKLSVASGGDTTISGAVLRARQVELDVGTNGKGNLNIASQQDTSTYQSRQQSLGGSVSVGMGKMGGSASYSQSKVNSDYASVIEQSGVKAGEGGFQVNVRGNTDLKGAVIASSEQAVAENKNRVTTKTLTRSDIENRASYEAQSVGISGGYSTGKDGGLSALPPLVVGASETATSTTRSGISGGVIRITDEKQQQALTGKTAEQTVASVNREVSSSKEGSNALKPIFDKEEIENRTAIAGAFTRELGSFLNNRAKEADEAKRKLDEAIADERAKPEEQRNEAKLRSLTDQYFAADQWSPGSGNRLLITSIAAALSGKLSGSSAQVMQAATVNYLQGVGAAQVKKIADSLDNDAARAALHGIVGCAGAVAKDASCGSGALGASAGTVLNNLLGSTDSLSSEEKEVRKNLVASIVAGIAKLSGREDVPASVVSAQLETEQNALGTRVNQFLTGMRSCSASSSESCFDELKEKTERDRRSFNARLDNACASSTASLLSCQDMIRTGQSAYPYIGLAMLYAKTGEQKEYVRQKLAEQENDLIAQYPRLEALGANASLTERMLVELASTIDNPAGAVVTLNSLRERILAIKSPTKGGSALPVPEIVIARNGLRYKSNSKHTTGSAGNYKKAGIEPQNSLDLFNSSIETSNKGTRLTLDKEGNIHRFFDDNTGTYHWSGSTADKKVPLTIDELRQSGLSRDLRKLGVK
ncbi:hemagglutinin repeat-containing protein [Herbaspirillum huttiense]|uniref:two-partner secretion domain-containing protein n=1 Tax=Herbaspirillum huttiense TaxID=863372 RepID=UPI0038779BA1